MSSNIMYNIDIKKLYNHLKSSAKRRNIQFDLKLSDLNNLSFNITCPILGIVLDYNCKNGIADACYSIDRINSNLGYISGNIQVISFKANRSKNNLTDKELEKFAQYFSKQ